MNLIRLHKPIPGPAGLARVHMFPGRHLGREEFKTGQDYADARLASLLRRARPGIVHGLELRLGPEGASGEGVTVSPGLAVSGGGLVLGLAHPLRAAWSDLLARLLERLMSAMQPDIVTGVYYLILKRDRLAQDDSRVDPCQRAEFDPSRDSQWVTAGRLELFRTAYALNDQPDRIANRVAAEQVDAAFLRGALRDAIPLALLGIGPASGGNGVQWLSVEAGRYEAVPDNGYRVLLNQVSASLRRVSLEAAGAAGSGTTLGDYLAAHLHLDYLPAAGQLPLDWLRAPASKTPSLLWLPPHLGIDMVPVPEETVLDILQRHLGRRPVDLRRPAGNHLRLLLAVNEPDYRGDLLDIPTTDTRLEQDVYALHQAAQKAWRNWRSQFDALYGVDPNGFGQRETERKALGLPDPEPPPPLPQSVFRAVIAEAEPLIAAGDGNRYPYDRGGSENPGYTNGIPAQPVSYTNWLARENPLVYPPSMDNGLIVRYALAQAELEAIQNQIRAIRSRLEKTRDFLLLQRQQLDTQTVALAALAGGVAGDGSGLKVARLLPYTSFDTGMVPDTTVAPAPAPSTSTGGAAARPFSGSLTRTIDLRGGAPTGPVAAPAAAAPRQIFNNPGSFSAFELGINNRRLELLGQASREAVTQPAFQTKEYRFGTIDHISPEVNEYARAFYGMKDLLANLPKLFDATDAAALRKQLMALGRPDPAEEPLPRSDLRKIQADLLKLLEDNDSQKLRAGLEAMTRTTTLRAAAAERTPLENAILQSPAELDRAATKKADGMEETDPRRISLLRAQYRYHGLFKAGRILTQWIAIFETRYNDLERRLESKLREHSAKAAELDKLAGHLRVAREALENLDRRRIEQLGDYGVARRLLDEDWRACYRRHQERTRILTQGLRGLYYVRVQTAPVSLPLADPLDLRFGGSRDIVPGCDADEDAQVPAELEGFFAAVTEIPMADWRALKPLVGKLPPEDRFPFLERLRQARFESRPTPSGTPSGAETLRARLQTLHLQTQSVIKVWAGTRLPAAGTSQSRTQAEAARVLSLEDLAGGAAGALRKDAQALREQLEQCQACLLDNLAKLPPSLRLLWARMAEDDQLRVEAVAWWPGLDTAERDDFNATRSVAELVEWWFRQRDPEAGANSLAALRNMIRATLIHAALGDPREILSGTVHIPPRRAAPGESLQLALNQSPPPGTRLQLLDAEQRLVAILAVEDHGPDGTQARIVDVVQSSVRIDTRCVVVAGKSSRSL